MLDDLKAIRYLDDVQRLSLKPGDVLVLRIDQPIDEETMVRMQRTLEAQFPGHKAIVLEGGAMQIGVMSPTDSTREERIEAKLDALIAALAEDEPEKPSRTLDGDLFGGERDQSQSLG